MTDDRADDLDGQRADDFADEAAEALPAPAAVLDEIERGRPLVLGHLRALHDPDRPTLERVLRFWPRIEAERRRDVITGMQHLAEDDATLDFHRIYLSALRDPDVATRILAVRGLYEEDRPEIMRLLAPMLTSDPSSDVKVEVARVLGQFVLAMEFGLLAEDDAETLIAALRDTIDDVEQDDQVRAACLVALGAAGDESTAELISDVYETGSHTMRLAALRAMGRSASDGWLELLVYHFDDEDADVRAVAAEAAGMLLADEAVPPLIILATEDREPDVQVAAILALGEIASGEAERVLSRWQRERLEPHLQEAIREALGAVHLMTSGMVHGRGTPSLADEDPIL